MAAMSTVLTEFSNNGNSRTSTLAGHTAAMPKLLIEKRRVPDGNQNICEYSFKVVEATEDADGVVLANKVSIEVIYRGPKDGVAATVTAALAVVKDVTAGDEFAASLSTLNWL